MNELEVRAAVKAAICWSDVLRSLGLVISGFTRNKVKAFCIAKGISTDHFDQTTATRRNKPTLGHDDVFCEGSKIARSSLRSHAIKVGLYTGVCAKCKGLDMWNNKLLTLELDHIDGICDNNVKTNLRWLCPNCHSQTDSYRKAKRLRNNEGS